MSVHFSSNIRTTDCWIVEFTFDVMFCLILVCLCFYLDHQFLSSTFIHVSLSSVFPSPSSMPVLPHLLCPCFPRCFSGLPQFVQQRAQFDSVSLVIQGSLEGELNLMDNLSGSICHYYSLPPRPSKHNANKKVNNRQTDDSLPPFHV